MSGAISWLEALIALGLNFGVVCSLLGYIWKTERSRVDDMARKMASRTELEQMRVDHRRDIDYLQDQLKGLVSAYQQLARDLKEDLSQSINGMGQRLDSSITGVRREVDAVNDRLDTVVGLLSGGKNG